MLIAKHVAKFDNSQSDSLLRKSVAKKKKLLMDICRRCFIFGKINTLPPDSYDENNVNQPFYDPEEKYGAPILGGINNGYSFEELSDFWSKMEGYSSYLFNRSHSQCYSIITLCTMYLKTYYKEKFFAALMSLQHEQEKIDLYTNVARKYGIKVKRPDINFSDYDFKEVNGDIYYGLKNLKGVGTAAIEAIIQNRPYASLEDAFKKIPKKFFNKKVGKALIQSGAFDDIEKNRYKLLNQFMDIRNDKDDRFVENTFSKEVIMEFEQDILGTCLTHIPLLNSLQSKDVFIGVFDFIDCRKTKDKKGNEMCFLTLSLEGIKTTAVVFASLYSKYQFYFNKNKYVSLKIKAEKTDRGIVVKEVLEGYESIQNIITENSLDDIW